MRRLPRTLLAIALLGTLALIPRGSAVAGQSIDPSTLNPVPPAGYSCQVDGANIICRRSLPPTPYGPSDNQLFCGTGANAFDTFDSGVESQRAVRYYDQNRNVVRRVIYFDDDGQWSNAVTGVSVPYEQHQITTDIPVVPGDLSAVTETTTGVNRFVLPHEGEILLDNGRVTTAPDGSIEFASARHDILSYVMGDTGAFQKLCAALGAT
jgi:hypothetical protein